jgi:sec-independent protein translocase protein TatC
MRKYRRHVIVVILIVGAIITPTGDPFTLTLVSIPIYLLWELSILIVKKVEK